MTTSTSAAESGVPTATPLDPVQAEQINEKAQSLIRTNMLIALGIGFSPFPTLDLVALLALQLNLVRLLGKLYGQEFSEDIVKKAVMSLIGSAVPLSMSIKVAAFSLLKAIPLIGPGVAVIVQPLLAGAMTYAVGQLLNSHFASGGTLLSFDPVRQKAYFTKLVEEGMKVAQRERATAGSANVATGSANVATGPVNVPVA
ncbi:MAG: DUF697 domain-containing protein [Planctomycetaceae bacterium]|nr:DUF697 domain-containing protein [Planctomycetaceae bacterium]MBV8268729.1 DUF697 domain-containing protein [Planctomycetaceae bacterium]